MENKKEEILITALQYSNMIGCNNRSKFAAKKKFKKQKKTEKQWKSIFTKNNLINK